MVFILFYTFCKYLKHSAASMPGILPKKQAISMLFNRDALFAPARFHLSHFANSSTNANFLLVKTNRNR